MFHEALIELEKKEDQSNGVMKTLNDICTLYACWAIEENASHFLKYGFFNGEQMDEITKEVTRLCAVLRVSAVALTDSFNFSDHIVRVPLHARRLSLVLISYAMTTDQLASRLLRWKRLRKVFQQSQGIEPLRTRSPL